MCWRSSYNIPNLRWISGSNRHEVWNNWWLYQGYEVSKTENAGSNRILSKELIIQYPTSSTALCHVRTGAGALLMFRIAWSISESKLTEIHIAMPGKYIPPSKGPSKIHLAIKIVLKPLRPPTYPYSLQTRPTHLRHRSSNVNALIEKQSVEPGNLQQSPSPSPEGSKGDFRVGLESW